MPVIYNASSETAEFRVFGSWFTLKSKQMKVFTDRVAHFIATNDTTKNLGLVGLSEPMEDPEYKASAEGKAELAEKEKEGIANRVAHLRRIIYNNQVSLKQDLDRANLKVDPRSQASKGEIKALEELVGYQTSKSDEEQKKIDHFKALERQLKD